MKEPADPKWQSRKWQTRYEPRADYIKRLYEFINHHKQMIGTYEATGARVPAVADGFVELINFEKKQLLDYQTELRKVMGR